METITEFYENLYHNQETVGMENWFRNNTDESVLSFLVKEIEVVLSKLKSGKADGPDNIANETLKIFGEACAPYLTKLFNDMVEKNWVPSQWKLEKIILLFKKGEREDINNCRPITLSSNLSKVFMTVLKNRIYNTLEENQSKEQAGFKKKLSTTDNIFVINQIIKKATEYNFEVKFLFIDFNKAFDSITHDLMWKALINQSISGKLIEIIRNIYDNSKAYIKTDKKGRKFNIVRGVRQGDPLSPK